jgi:uncharacterized protein YdaU (DUF1376 family)
MRIHYPTCQVVASPRGPKPVRSYRWEQSTVNWYEHHIGDWTTKCLQLSAMDEGIYLRLCHWCYSNESPLPLAMEDVERCARVNGSAEKNALTRVLNRFFDLLPDGWHQSRVEKEVAKFRSARPVSTTVREGQNLRQQRSREYRRSLFAALRQNGIVPSMKTKNEALIEMLQTIGTPVPPRDAVTAPVTAYVTAPVTADGHDTLFPLPTTHRCSYEHLAVTGVVTECDENGTKLPQKEAIPLPVTAFVSAAGNACKAMRRAGLAEVNPGDPRLLALLQRGITTDALTSAAAEASARSKPWGYALGIAKNRFDDDERARAEVLAWAPQLATLSQGEHDA